MDSNHSYTIRRGKLVKNNGVELENLIGFKDKFIATFVCFKIEKMPTYTKMMVLLHDVRDEGGTLLADHIWLTDGKRVSPLRPRKGDLISFQAKVKFYKGNYVGKSPGKAGLHKIREVRKLALVG